MRQTPVYLAHTRPPMPMGIPYGFWILLFCLTGGLVLTVNWKASVLIVLTLYGLMWALAQYEPRFGRILWVSFKKISTTKNKAQNGGNLYRA